jgi:hypothetical protein
MIACPHCGAQNEQGTLACQRCTAPLGWPAEPAPTAWAPLPPQAQGWGAMVPAPYAYPAYSPVPTPWQEGNKLVLPQGAHLPDRCVKCNAPAEGRRLQRNLSWIHPAYLLTLFAGVLIFAIVAAVASKKATVDVGICEKHLAQRRLAIAGGWGLALLGIFFFWLAIYIEAWWPLYPGVAALLVGMFGGVALARVVHPAKIDDGRVWLRGVDRAYLRELPAPPPWG